MNIIVCIKQVPSTNEVRLDPVTKTIIRDGRQSVINPFDTFAIEAGVQLKERYGGKVTALSMGIPATEVLLRDAMSRGVDESLLLTDRAFAGADTLATSYALSLGVERIGGADLIICGKMAIDGDTAQIGPELSAQLGLPCVTDVCEIKGIDNGVLRCVKQTSAGYREMEVKLPGLITVLKDINEPRFPSIAGIRYSLGAPFEACGAADVGADIDRSGLKGSPTSVVRSFAPERDHEAVKLTGSGEELAGQVLSIIEEVR